MGDARPMIVWNIAAHAGYIEFALWWCGNYPYLNVWTDITVFDASDPQEAN